MQFLIEILIVNFDYVVTLNIVQIINAKSLAEKSMNN